MYVYICLDLIDPFAFYFCSKTPFTQRICLSSVRNRINSRIFFEALRQENRLSSGEERVCNRVGRVALPGAASRVFYQGFSCVFKSLTVLLKDDADVLEKPKGDF